MIQNTSSQDVILTKNKTAPIKLILIVFVLIILSFAIYSLISNWNASDKTVDSSRLRIASVEKGMFTRDVSLQGNIIAANSPKLYSPSIGTVTLLSNPGEIVKLGDVVAKVASPTLLNRLQQEKAKLFSLNIEFERQKIATKQAVSIYCDPSQLQQAIINLVKNAHESGGNESEISISVKVNVNDYEIVVTDRGKGMSEKNLSNALLPFYSTRAGGTGLGLPLCREIVEAHNGKILINNRKNGGLKITIILPNRNENP